MNSRKWKRLAGRSRSRIFLFAVAFAFGFLDTGGARPTEGEVAGRICKIGNVSLPEEIFQVYAGWECFEETFDNAGKLDVFICTERFRDTRYSVPCFKERRHSVSYTVEPRKGSFWKNILRHWALSNEIIWNNSERKGDASIHAGRRTLTFNLKNEETVTEILERFGSSRLNDEMIRCYLGLVMACEASPDGWLRGGNGFRFFLYNTTEVCTLEGQNKFHIAMLSISMIIGIPSALIFFFCHRFTEIPVLSHCRDLVLALLARTFFTLAIETIVVSKVIESPEEELKNWAGCEALASFEVITLNLANAFWLILTFHLLEYSKSGFEKEPDIRKGKYIVLGLSLVLPIVWIIIMAVGGYGNCWLERTPIQWVNDSLRIGFLIIQIILISLVVYRVFAEVQWIEDKDYLRKISCTTMALSPLFLLQFSLSASHPRSAENSDAHTYTEYFFDGLQCGLVSLSYLLLAEVRKFFLDTFGFESIRRCERVLETVPHAEASVDRRKEITIVEPVESRRDITYSSVLTPERFEKTINLYNRLNIIPKHEPAIQIDRHDSSSVKSEYFDFETDFEKTIQDDVAKYSKQLPVKNRFYSSKYLVQDSDGSVSEEEEKGENSEGLREEGAKAMETWLKKSESECRRFPEGPSKNETANGKTPLRRSLSGNIITCKKIPGSVAVDPKMLEKPRWGPTRGLFAPEPELRPKAVSGLPSIYDDLKNYKKKPGDTRGRKREHKADRNRIRIVAKRRIKSEGAVEEPKKEESLSPQLDALLSPGYDAEKLKPGSLKKNQFLHVAEDLSADMGSVEKYAKEE